MSAQTGQSPSKSNYTYTVNTGGFASGPTYIPSIVITNGTGGGGGAGSVLTNSGNWTVSTPTTQFNSDLKITPKDGRDAIVETNHHKINLDQMQDLHTTLSELLGVLYKDNALHEKYPTLADIYERWCIAKRNALEKINIDPEMRQLYNEYQALKALLTAEGK